MHLSVWDGRLNVRADRAFHHRVADRIDRTSDQDRLVGRRIVTTGQWTEAAGNREQAAVATKLLVGVASRVRVPEIEGPLSKDADGVDLPTGAFEPLAGKDDVPDRRR